MSRLMNSNNHEIVLVSPILKNLEKDTEVENVVNNDDGVEESEDWSTPLAFSDERHLKKIEPAEIITQSWRLKERMKTVSVALVLCLNVGVDPPDVVKTQPAARMECWIDPLSMSPQKALENIGSNLQKQYERWQPRARYKQTLDPTAEEIKKVTTTLRRNAKDERVLFHYNGHGVPKPTANGEIWVFNRSYTQYIPLSIYDLQSWMWSPSIYVFDCSNAGMIIDWFQQFAEQHQREYDQLPAQRGGNQSQLPPPPSFKQCIQLAACATNQILPMNPELPADLFTSCLTTPIKMALRWFVLQNTSRLVPRITLELVDKIPGQLNDRRTMLGELNWIFTAITDTIAWNSLPRELFQRLFRQDLLVASLFRNYLLAERIMRSYDCTPVSHPKLPPTYQHPMWAAWDLALDVCLSQLPSILEDKATFQISMFFEEQLTAFQVWLSHGCEERAPPEQLPIVLQVLLSQVHRVRALELLGRFLDLGSWAVNQALSVGIFPYVLKLLQSSARELRPMLLFIWAKILAVDVTCQVDLVRDGGHKYFLSVLQEPDVPNDHRTLAAFVLARIVWDYSQGQEAVTQAGFISHALELVHDSPPLLRRWLIIGVGLTWHLDESARWYAVRDSAHEKLFPFLQDSVPEVRCATVFAFATFIRSGSKSARSEHANNIDQSIALRLANYIQSESSPLVRKEIVSALQWIVLIFESMFVQLVLQQMDDERQRDQGLSSPLQTSTTDYGGGLSRNNGGLNRVHSYQTLGTSPDLPSPLVTETSLNSSASSGTLSRLRRPPSSSSLNNLGYPNSPGLPNLSIGSIYGKLWTALTALEKDPHPDVAAVAQAVCEYIRAKAKSSLNVRDNENMRFSTSSTSSSESQRYEGGESPPRNSQRLTPSLSRIRKRSVPTTIAEEGNSMPKTFREPIVGTSFVEWSVRRWSSPNSTDPVSAESAESKETFYLREWRFARNATVRTEARKEQQVAATGRLDEQLFCNRNPWVPSAIKFHPYDSWLAVADKEGCTVWDWERGVRLCRFINPQPKIARITSIEFVNGHDDAMLLVGSDDGTVRVWRNFLSSEAEDSASASLVTAWHCMPEMANAMHYSGLVLTWDQDNQTLAATGDLKVIRLWDVNKEFRICDIPTGSDKCVTCIHQSSQDRNLFLIGCGDGSVRLFDRRLQASRSRVQTWREHAAWIVDADWMNATTIVSGSLAGDVRFWDPRSSGSSNSFQTSQAMTAMAVHPSANIFACGSVNEYISVHNSRAGLVSTIKYHDGGGFMGHRIGAVSCLTFHPHRVCLAAGGMDSLVSVFATEKIRK